MPLKIFIEQHRDEKTLGLMARELLDNPVFEAVMQHLLRGHAETMLGSAPNDKDKREQAYVLVNALYQIEARLQSLAAQNESES